MFEKLAELLKNAGGGLNPLPEIYQVHTDGSRCVQCGICGFNCPVNIPVRDFARQNLTMTDPRCIGCGMCVQRCPRGTLSFKPALHPLDAGAIPPDPDLLAMAMAGPRARSGGGATRHPLPHPGQRRRRHHRRRGDSPPRPARAHHHPHR
ncbi:MAG: 4Fe-4S dicluster domain-containing protein [Chloroflexi bacterium]|nr:4Fe-4S dicluster domain-containing protein [Chloroflexota bacterium]